MVFSQVVNKGYRKPQVYSEKDKIKVKRLKGLVIDLNEVFKAAE